MTSLSVDRTLKYRNGFDSKYSLSDTIKKIKTSTKFFRIKFETKLTSVKRSVQRDKEVYHDCTKSLFQAFVMKNRNNKIKKDDIKLDASFNS